MINIIGKGGSDKSLDSSDDLSNIQRGLRSKLRTVGFLLDEGHSFERNLEYPSKERHDSIYNIPRDHFTFGLGIDMLKTIEAQDNDGKMNTCISPLSIAFLLMMIWIGSKGETKEGFEKYFGLIPIEQSEMKNVNMIMGELYDLIINLSKDGIDFNVTNGIFVDGNIPILPEYKQLVENHLSGTVDSLIGVKQINDWVSSMTKGKIDTIIKDLDPNVALILINAIYFKGIWENQFNKARTVESKFHLSDGTTKDCIMMNRAGLYKYTHYLTAGGLSAKLIDLPYLGSKLSMTIVLPDYDSDIKDINSYVKGLDKGILNTMLNYHDDSPFEKEVGLSMPKFKIESEMGLNDSLNSLGLGNMFGPGADLTGISDSDSLYVDKVIHKTYIDVNEEGTEAAAVTSAMVSRSVNLKGESMILNRPFIYLIRENNGNIVFAGTVKNP